jgi:rare lipoprotein A
MNCVKKSGYIGKYRRFIGFRVLYRTLSVVSATLPARYCREADPPGILAAVIAAPASTWQRLTWHYSTARWLTACALLMVPLSMSHAQTPTRGEMAASQRPSGTRHARQSHTNARHGGGRIAVREARIGHPGAARLSLARNPHPAATWPGGGSRAGETPASVGPAAPLVQAVWLVESGVASYYGAAHQGRRTASGTRFDQNVLTAAHPWLPFGTRMRVTVGGSDRSVVVVVTDRLYSQRRIVDLSAAARKLGIVQRGLATVSLTPL